MVYFYVVLGWNLQDHGSVGLETQMPNIKDSWQESSLYGIFSGYDGIFSMEFFRWVYIIIARLRARYADSA